MFMLVGPAFYRRDESMIVGIAYTHFEHSIQRRVPAMLVVDVD